MSGNGFFDLSEKLKKPRNAAAAQGPVSPDKTLSVSDVTKVIDKAIRAGVPANLAVRGEVSNFNHNHGSGHAYFTLKDASACLNCVMFNSEFSRVKFVPKQGMELLAIGSIRIYAQTGRYQLYVNDLQPLGRGALELAFQQLHERLKNEGLFRIERKKAIPKYPTRIAIVTSRQTAALQDILKVMTRFPWIRTTVVHVPVQGETCGPQIAAAIITVNRQAVYDVILLSRGGGSLEDLWGFNHEAVAHAIAGSVIPVITGIGHEIDTTIADLVADHHAHTPTEAAQVATTGWRGVNTLLDSIANRFDRQIRSAVQEAHHRLNVIERDPFFRRPTERIQDLRMLLDDRQRSLRLGMDELFRSREKRLRLLDDRLQRQAPAVRLQRSAERLQQMQRKLLAAMGNRLRSAGNRLEKDAALLAEHHPRNTVALLRANLSADDHRLTRAIGIHLQRQSERIGALSNELQALSPQRVLERGYSVTRLKKTGVIVRNAAQLKERDHIVTRFQDGEVESTVEDPQQPKLFV